MVTTGSPLTTTTMATTTSAVPEFQAERRRPVCSAEVKAFLHTSLFPIFIYLEYYFPNMTRFILKIFLFSLSFLSFSCFLFLVSKGFLFLNDFIWVSTC